MIQLQKNNIAKFLQAKNKQNVSNYALLDLVRRRLTITTFYKSDKSFTAKPNNVFYDILKDEEIIRTKKVTENLLDYVQEYDCLFFFTTNDPTIEGHCEFLTSNEVRHSRQAIKAAHLELTSIIPLKK